MCYPLLLIGPCPDHIVCAQCNKLYGLSKPLKLLLLLCILVLNPHKDQHSLLACKIVYRGTFNTNYSKCENLQLSLLQPEIIPKDIIRCTLRSYFINIKINTNHSNFNNSFFFYLSTCYNINSCSITFISFALFGFKVHKCHCMFKWWW